MHNKGHEIYSTLVVTELHKDDEGVVPTASLTGRIVTLYHNLRTS